MRVAPEAIKRTALLTIEGELDDISGIGQTRAALPDAAFLGDLDGDRRLDAVDAHVEQHRIAQAFGHFERGSDRRNAVAPRLGADHLEVFGPHTEQ